MYTKQTRRIIFLYQQKIIVTASTWYFLLHTTIFSVCTMIKTCFPSISYMNSHAFISLAPWFLHKDVCSCWKCAHWRKRDNESRRKWERQRSVEILIVFTLGLHCWWWWKILFAQDVESVSYQLKTTKRRKTKEETIKWWIIWMNFSWGNNFRAFIFAHKISESSRATTNIKIKGILCAKQQ